MSQMQRIAVIIPCYRVREQILPVIQSIGPEAGWIFVVDDACPQNSADWVEQHNRDSRVQVIRHSRNLGVGGAMLSGYRAALNTPAQVLVKIDGDGQMDPAQIPRIAGSLLAGRADYAKGNRFHRISYTRGMPVVRLIGNACLSFLSKLSSGYWQVSDPTNGYTAIRRELLAELELDDIAPRYFFESDLLYHLNQARAVVVDVPMRAQYQDEPSSLSPTGVALPFLAGHLRNIVRRVGYTYFLRAFSLASIELLIGGLLLAAGGVFGACQWLASMRSGIPATAGTVMLAALPIIIGIQMLLSWLNFDIASELRHPVHALLGEKHQPTRDGE